MTGNKNTNNLSLSKPESASQVKQQIFYELIQDNNYHTNPRKKMLVQTEHSKQI